MALCWTLRVMIGLDGLPVVEYMSQRLVDKKLSWTRFIG